MNVRGTKEKCPDPVMSLFVNGGVSSTKMEKINIFIGSYKVSVVLYNKLLTSSYFMFGLYRLFYIILA